MVFHPQEKQQKPTLLIASAYVVAVFVVFVAAIAIIEACYRFFGQASTIYIYIYVDTRIYLYIYKFGVVGIFSVVVVAVFDFFRSRPAWEMFATRLQSNGKSGFSFELKKKTKTKTTMYEIRKFACLRSFGRSSVRLFVSGLRFSRSLAQPSDKFLLQQSY